MASPALSTNFHETASGRHPSFKTIEKMNVPETFLVPMVLRETNKRKMNLLK